MYIILITGMGSLGVELNTALWLIYQTGHL